ncbi:MAG: MMPL family transporter [Tatlockia sp.]|nr:MMPL family transporter [Tatlockia sp.]
MEKNIFYKLGNLAYSLRWYLIALWSILILVSVFVLVDTTAPFKSTGFSDENSKSVKAQDFINKKLGYNDANKFLIIYHSSKLLAADPLFNTKIKKSLAKLDDFPIKHEIILPSENKNQISKDKHTAYVALIIKSKEVLDDKKLAELEALIQQPSDMTVTLGGQALFINEINKQTETDLYRADFIATPAAIITLLLVFGSLTAALLPILLGGGCALVILTSLYLIGQSYTLSIYTLNIALLLGLCLSLDYSLFIIYRFREELRNGKAIKNVIATTVETAGKAIFFSGLAVLVSLSALFLFPINILFSMAVGGIIAVLVAVLNAIVVLPAVLGVLKHRIDFLSLPFNNKEKAPRSAFWHWLAEKIVKRPLAFFFPILAFLLLLGYPFLSAKFGVSDYRITPKNSESRQFFDRYEESFNIKDLTPLTLLIKSPNSEILSLDNLVRIDKLVNKLEDYSSIKSVKGIISSNSKLTAKNYHMLYSLPKAQRPDPVKKLLSTTTRSGFTILTINSKYELNSEKTSALVKKLKNTKFSSSFHTALTGTPVVNVDVLAQIYKNLPYAILWIMFFTYFILLILLRSLLLPLKAILVNLLSLCACYGALVLVFQDGYLANFLNFEPQGILDISLLVIIFCALFGFSMDYEVFLLSRINEAYLECKDNKKSIVFGIERSSRIITSAALIVIVICASFLVADVLMVKAFGLGIAVAIFVDAFLIRTFLVPSAMALLGKWCWYLPKWMDKTLPKL